MWCLLIQGNNENFGMHRGESNCLLSTGVSTIAPTLLTTFSRFPVLLAFVTPAPLLRLCSHWPQVVFQAAHCQSVLPRALCAFIYSSREAASGRCGRVGTVTSRARRQDARGALGRDARGEVRHDGCNGGKTCTRSEARRDARHEGHEARREGRGAMQAPQWWRRRRAGGSWGQVEAQAALLEIGRASCRERVFNWV